MIPGDEGKLEVNRRRADDAIRSDIWIARECVQHRVADAVDDLLWHVEGERCKAAQERYIASLRALSLGA